MQDYAYAALLGESRQACSYRVDAAGVLHDEGDDGDGLSRLWDWFATSSSSWARSSALFLSTMLRTPALRIATDWAYLTDSLDPAGCPRQQPKMVADQLNVAAVRIFEISQALAC